MSSGLRTPPIFDGHNDLLLKLHRGETDAGGVLSGYRGGHIDLPRARRGGYAGGFFAVYVPGSVEEAEAADDLMRRPRYDVALPPAIGWSAAIAVALDQIAWAHRLEAAGVVTICRDVATIEEAIAGERMAAVLHVEGAEAIDADFAALEVFHAAGLRSLGPVWSRPNAFGHGVPFRYPSTGDTGPGLTDLGKELVRRCNALRIMLDVSHLNERGFDDLAGITDAPLVATHSNAHAVCPHARNLTDRQLERIRDSDGMVGLNFAAAFLRPDGRMDSDVGLDLILRHLEHLIGILGEDRVGFGSDFDGATVPDAIGDCSGLPALRRAMLDHGFGEALMEKLCWRNWTRVLAKTWGA
ncbi:MAG: dipeptidase [Microvirga sp.]|nr:dipeptidase [Microvirga sp.]